MLTKYILIETGTEEKRMRIDFNALCEIEMMLGKSMTQFAENIGLNEMRVVLYCSLRWSDRKITLAKAGELCAEIISNKGMEYLGEKISEAMKHALKGMGIEVEENSEQEDDTEKN